MASIQTGIQLQDGFTNVMMGLINSVNIAISSMEEMNHAMSADVDTSSLQAAREELAQATIAANELNAVFENMQQPEVTVPEPVQWQSADLNAFTTAGIERFQQEATFANQMLVKLADRQDQIAQNASNTDIFSESAIQDITSMNQRIQALQSRIHQFESNPLHMGSETANAELEQLRSRLNQALQAQEQLNRAVEDMDVSAANSAYNQLSQTINNTERYIRDNATQQQKLNKDVKQCNTFVRNTGAGFKTWQRGIIVANNLLNMTERLLGRFGITDLSGAFNRIDTMNRFKKTITTLTKDSNAANAAMDILNNTVRGTAYGLDVASKSAQGFTTRGMSLKAATDQVRTWADAVSFYGEGTNEQLESVVDAVGKIYSKGTVEQDQLDRLFDAGIPAVELYAKAVHRNIASVKDDLSKGNISAAEFLNTVSNAVESGDASGAAKKAADSWATTFANVGAAVTRGWQNIITSLDDELAARGLPTTMQMFQQLGVNVESMLNGIADNMGMIVDVATTVGDAVGSVAGFINDHWSVIGPVIASVTTAMIAFKIATMAAAGAQAILNLVMTASPITWIILGLSALAGVLLFVAHRIAQTGGTAKTTAGVICGWLNVVRKNFEYQTNAIRNYVSGIKNFIIAIIYDIKAVLYNTTCTIKSQTYDMLSTIVQAITDLCKALDQIPFVDIDYSGMAQAANDYASKAAEAANSRVSYLNPYKEFLDGASKYEVYPKGWINNAYREGANFGDKLWKNVQNLFKKKEEDKNSKTLAKLPGSTALTSDVAKTAQNTKKTADALSTTAEDLKYLRDIAERNYVNRYTTTNIKISQTNHNKVNSDMDLDGVTEHLRSTLEKQMAAYAEGVH